MAAVASLVVVAGTVTGVLADGGGAADEAGRKETQAPTLEPLPAIPTPSPSVSGSGSPKPSKSPSKKPGTKAPKKEPKTSTASASNGLYLHGQSQVLDWVRANAGDPRHAQIKSQIADRPAAVWFADYSPDTITSRVRSVTSGGAARDQVPTVVAYGIPDRDCGGHSQGGAPDLGAYDAWIQKFAAGLGSSEVIVILEPDSLAQFECLDAGRRSARFASLARAGRTLKAANPNARVYYDAGHSGWHSPSKMASALRQAGAASSASSDGIFTNVSNFHRTDDEVAYAQSVLSALGGPSGLGAVIDTSRNGNGAPPDGEWCDPAGRKLGRPPTLSTGRSRIDAFLWVKLPGESDGCKGKPGTFTPSYAYDLVTGS
ncbi:glycoside hydrolase family 6 protein [Streptomyces sp. TRM66268-LWL]|uniref:Glucanase n=1 Tax=Streptomyces polyasparticus TaxID=2767826 RepID=A0ABR7SSU1_9ACTN|nr:glycoside hydrolase family 6 protein [Streptomyces polyasparticus]MBC9718473.1 glycoside hydrolase family 6 protein [Streptomyces polyasparticus]